MVNKREPDVLKLVKMENTNWLATLLYKNLHAIEIASLLLIWCGSCQMIEEESTESAAKSFFRNKYGF